jgi:hypothetical protein
MDEQSDLSGHAVEAIDRGLELTKLKLELAKIQLQLQQAQGQNSVSQQPEESNEVRKFLGTLVANSRSGRHISIFHEKAKAIKKSPALTSAASYPTWKEGIIQVTKQLGINAILSDQQIKPPIDDPVVQDVWKAQNDWLYRYVWASLAQQAKVRITPPDNIIAYTLWKSLEIAFAERPEAARRRLGKELREITLKSIGGNRAYLKRVLAIRTELYRLEYPPHDYEIFDLIYTNISNHYHEILQSRIDQATKSGSNLPEKDLVATINDLLARLPVTNSKDQSLNKTPTNSVKESKDQRSSDKPNQRFTTKCKHCEKPGHTEDKCWIKHPEKAPKDRNTNKDKERKKEKEKRPPSKNPGPAELETTPAFNITEKSAKSDTWVMDSGSGSHATSQQNLVKKDPTITPRGSLLMGNGSTAPIKSIGTTNIPSNNGELTLQRTRLVPDLGVNIISFGQLVLEGFNFKQLEYGGQHSILWTSPDQSYSFETILNQDKVYILQPSPRLQDLVAFALPLQKENLEPAHVATVLNKEQDDSLLTSSEHATGRMRALEDTMENWHIRLGHLNEEDIKILARDPRTGVQIRGPKKLRFCKVCVQAKQTKKPYPPAPPSHQTSTGILC